MKQKNQMLELGVTLQQIPKLYAYLWVGNGNYDCLKYWLFKAAYEIDTDQPKNAAESLREGLITLTIYERSAEPPIAQYMRFLQVRVLMEETILALDPPEQLSLFGGDQP